MEYLGLLHTVQYNTIRYNVWSGGDKTPLKLLLMCWRMCSHALACVPIPESGGFQWRDGMEMRGGDGDVVGCVRIDVNACVRWKGGWACVSRWVVVGYVYMGMCM